MASSPKNTGSTLERLLQHVKLSWRLFRDPHVSPLVRYGIPLIGLVYLLSPVDVVPDVLLGLGQLDDAAVLLLLSQLMIMLAPQDVVNRYRPSGDHTPHQGKRPHQDEEVIDADYRVVS